MALRSDAISSAGVHEVHVLGERLAQRAGHGLHAAVGHQPPPDLGLDLLAELVDAGLVLVPLQPLLQQGFGSLLPGLLHQAVEHAVEVEVPQRAVQVVGAADRPAGLHPRVAPHRLAGQGLRHGLVALGQRSKSISASSSGRHLVAHAAGAPLVSWASCSPMSSSRSARAWACSSAYSAPRSEK